MTQIDYGWDASMGIPLVDKIKQDLKTAMLGKDDGARNTMRLIMGEYPKLTIKITLESGKKTTRVKKTEEITDDDLLDIIRGFVKSERTMLELKNQKTSEYLELLNRYLPKMATREEIAQWIRDNVDLSNFKSPMQAMGPVMKHYGKLAQGDLVKDVLKEIGTK